MKKKIRRIAVNTGGGDAPGLNAVIRAVVLAGCRRGWEVLGIRKGYTGLLDTSHIVQLTPESVRGITHHGGSILGTINRGNPFEFPLRLPDGTTTTIDRSDEVVANYKNLGLDAIIAIGGDGSMRIANRLAEKGVAVVGVPKTIDNDLEGTVATFGFDTAVTVATEALDRLHSTAEAHERVFVVEVMGRYAGWIALHAGVAGGADVILIPEIPFDINAVCRKIMDREAQGRHFSIVVVAEGAKPKGGEMVFRVPAEAGREARLGGISEIVAAQIAAKTGKETRSMVLGHLQRGGMPTARDRTLALQFGTAAVRMINQGKFSVMVALDPPHVRAVPLTTAIRGMRTVPLDDDVLDSARDMGLSLGDEDE
jgi:ATP-dependent phosphofructokinase / diphosphate-dependent phosphofructokinase